MKALMLVFSVAIVALNVTACGQAEQSETALLDTTGDQIVYDDLTRTHEVKAEVVLKRDENGAPVRRVEFSAVVNPTVPGFSTDVKEYEFDPASKDDPNVPAWKLVGTQRLSFNETNDAPIGDMNFKAFVDTPSVRVYRVDFALGSAPNQIILAKVQWDGQQISQNDIQSRDLSGKRNGQAVPSSDAQCSFGDGQGCGGF